MLSYLADVLSIVEALSLSTPSNFVILYEQWSSNSCLLLDHICDTNIMSRYLIHFFACLPTVSTELKKLKKKERGEFRNSGFEVSLFSKNHGKTQKE